MTSPDTHGRVPVQYLFPLTPGSDLTPGLERVLSNILGNSSANSPPTFMDLLQQNPSPSIQTRQNNPRPPARRTPPTYIHTVQRPTIQYRSSKSNDIRLGDYIEAFGNYYPKSKLYFIAARFKRPVVSYKCTGFSPSPIQPPEHTAVIVHPSMNLDLVQNSSNLLFSVKTPHSMCYYATDTSEGALLKALFPEHSILFSRFDSSTLYAVVKRNPFTKFWTKCNRTEAFRALTHLYDVCQLGRGELTLKDIATLRFFRRNLYNPKLFKTWYALAVAICEQKAKRILDRLPTAQCGLMIHRILTRAKTHLLPENHPPNEFYLCQLWLDESLATGVQFRVEGTQVVYVSTMVVSESREGYQDTNFVTCNRWVPLLKNLDHLNDFVIPWYVRHLSENLYLSQVIAWLSIQTAEKHKQLQLDLDQIHFIVYGHTVQSRWISTNITDEP